MNVKKIFLIALSMLLILTGCNNKSKGEVEYENLKKYRDMVKETTDKYIKEKGLKSQPWIFSTYIILPENLDKSEVGEILKEANDLSKKEGYDFSKYLGESVLLYSINLYNEEARNNNEEESGTLNILYKDNEIIGCWIEPKEFKERPSGYSIDNLIYAN